MADRTAALEAAFAERIIVLDGSMGVLLQGYGFDEAAYRGERFADHGQPLKGNMDLLVLTQPQVIESVHDQYFAAGADIVETNTFTATTVAMADYGLPDHVVDDLNLAGARLARRAADRAEAADGRPRFVAGSMGPTNKTASLSPDVNDPGFRAITFAELADAYERQARALVEGGVDLLLPETAFDTLNLKAASPRHRPDVRGRRAPRAGDRLGHDHRPLGSDPVGARPSRRSTNSISTTARPVRGQHQLRPGRRRSAAVRRGAVADRRAPDRGLSQRRPAQRVRRLRRHPGPTWPASWATSRARAGSTWSAAAAARGPSTSGRSPRRSATCRRAPGRAARALDPAGRPRAADPDPRVELHADRRAAPTSPARRRSAG
jgi:hypothetical protein